MLATVHKFYAYEIANSQNMMASMRYLKALINFCVHLSNKIVNISSNSRMYIAFKDNIFHLERFLFIACNHVTYNRHIWTD